MTTLSSQRRNAYQWTLLRDSVLGILKRFEKDEHGHTYDELIKRAQDARPDGYPTGAGTRGSGVADPTLSAVLGREQLESGDSAWRALTEFKQALDLLETADRHRQGAFPPQPKPVEPEGWCSVDLAVIGWHNPVDTSRKWAQPNTRCSWCSAWFREHAFDAPKWMLRKRARGERVTTLDEARAMREHEAERTTAKEASA